MYKRPTYQVLLKRLEEPRRFMQVLAGPRQAGKTTLIEQVLGDLQCPSHYASADEPVTKAGVVRDVAIVAVVRVQGDAVCGRAAGRGRLGRLRVDRRRAVIGLGLHAAIVMIPGDRGRDAGIRRGERARARGVRAPAVLPRAPDAVVGIVIVQRLLDHRVAV